MAFYIVVKGHITPFDFAYIENEIPIHLESTQIHGSPPKGKSKEAKEHLQKEVFALEVMSRNLITLSPANLIREAADLMLKHKIHHIPLVIDKRLTGVISHKDISHSETVLDQEIRLDKVMSKMVLCASEYTPLRHVAQVFVRENINSLPIVDDDLIVTGIITHRDLVRWLLDHHKFQN